jgi:hypothetical protein
MAPWFSGLGVSLTAKDTKEHEGSGVLKGLPFESDAQPTKAQRPELALRPSLTEF